MQLSLFDIGACKMHLYALIVFRLRNFDDDFVSTVHMNAFCMKLMTGNDLLVLHFLMQKWCLRFKYGQTLPKLLI